jgi:hypothetical protein
MTREQLTTLLDTLNKKQDMNSISIQYDDDEFIGVEAITIMDNILILYAVDEESEVSLTYDDLKYFLGNVNFKPFYEVKIVFEEQDNELEITNMKIDDGEFEDTLGDEDHPYFI